MIQWRIEQRNERTEPTKRQFSLLSSLCSLREHRLAMTASAGHDKEILQKLSPAWSLLTRNATCRAKSAAPAFDVLHKHCPCLPSVWSAIIYLLCATFGKRESNLRHSSNAQSQPPARRLTICRETVLVLKSRPSRETRTWSKQRCVKAACSGVQAWERQAFVGRCSHGSHLDNCIKNYTVCGDKAFE